ncbi:hypothetical protein [Pseudomonas duriflava]|uniref:hypothetical protein n=1 Tax=Pseudomonas duriflava TaxID=459528 RepID=UPI0011A6A2A9|nr:hypothetical protein [Pseudomonas duriflava]
MNEPPFSLEQIASRSGQSKMDRLVRHWLIGLPVAARIDFLKQLWPLNYRFALILTQAAQLPKRENQDLFKYLLRTSSHNAAEELINRFEPILGKERFWQIASVEELSPAMQDFLNYHSGSHLKRLSSE